MKLNLSKKIVLMVVLVILFISLGLGFVSFKTSSDALISQTEDALLQLSEEGVRHIDAVITGNINTLEEVANGEFIKTMDLEDQKRTLNPEVTRLGYEDMGIVTPDGKGYMILNEAVLDLSNMDFVQKALRGESNISDVFISDDTVKIVYAVPIMEGSKVVGALIGNKDGLILSDITDQMGFGEKGYAYIMKNDGTLFAHPNRDNVINGRSVLEDINTDGEFKNWGLAIEEIGVGNDGVASYELLGSRRLIGISYMEDQDWIVGVGAHQDDILEELDKLKLIILIVTTIFIFIGTIAATFLGRNISRPIVGLSHVVERMSNYDLSLVEDREIDKVVKREDEIGHMARS